MIVLGLNAYHGDAAAALIVDGRIAAAVEEERLNRVKHCAGFPALAVRSCLESAGVSPGDVDHVAIGRRPRSRIAHRLWASLRHPRRLARSLPDRLRNVAKVGKIDETLAEALGIPRDRLRARFHAVEHHRAHLASAFYPSPFEKAALLSIDGFGDFVSTMAGLGEGRRVRPLWEVRFPHSLGVFYTAITQWLGFPKYGDEGKVMGLAPYGRPTFLDDMRRLVRLTPGGFELDTSWFRHETEGVAMTWAGGSPTLGPLFSQRLVDHLGPARRKEEPLTERHHDVAASLQAMLEEAIFHLLAILHRQTGATSLGVTGGVAYNSVTNGKIRTRTPFRDLWFFPAAGDSGTAVGAALEVAHGVDPRHPMPGPYLGPAYADDRIAAALAAAGLAAPRVEPADLVRRTAERIEEGKIVGWFQGAVEFGPRALGNRSILVDPRRPDMKDTLNLRIKHREAFRPFAPVVLEEKVADWFEDAYPSPYMLLVLPIRPEKRALIPAVTHVDGSGRLQTVSREMNPLYYDLVAEFGRRTGVPVLLNTSFNENEPNVCSPEEAIRCFQETGMDVLAIGPYLLERPPA